MRCSKVKSVLFGWSRCARRVFRRVWSHVSFRAAWPPKGLMRTQACDSAQPLTSARAVGALPLTIFLLPSRGFSLSFGIWTHVNHCSCRAEAVTDTLIRQRCLCCSVAEKCFFVCVGRVCRMVKLNVIYNHIRLWTVYVNKKKSNEFRIFSQVFFSWSLHD